MIPRFDVFSGSVSGTTAVWMDCADSLETARDKMETLCAENPGPYFVYSAELQRIVANIDTAEEITRNSEDNNHTAVDLMRANTGWTEEEAPDHTMVFRSGNAILKIFPDGHWRCTVTRDLRKTAVQGPIEELERFLKEFAELNPQVNRQSA
jgi:hypothetical protein